MKNLTITFVVLFITTLFVVFVFQNWKNNEIERTKELENQEEQRNEELEREENEGEEGEVDGVLYFWDFTSISKNASELQELGRNKNNFYALSGFSGSGGFGDVYVFKNGELFFAKEGIYQGRVFFDKDNNLNIIKGISSEGDPNCCPSTYELEQYRYNSDSSAMYLSDTRIYSAEQIADLEKAEKLLENPIEGKIQ